MLRLIRSGIVATVFCPLPSPYRLGSCSLTLLNILTLGQAGAKECAAYISLKSISALLIWALPKLLIETARLLVICLAFVVRGYSFGTVTQLLACTPLVFVDISDMLELVFDDTDEYPRPGRRRAGPSLWRTNAATALFAIAAHGKRLRVLAFLRAPRFAESLAAILVAV